MNFENLELFLAWLERIADEDEIDLADYLDEAEQQYIDTEKPYFILSRSKSNTGKQEIYPYAEVINTYFDDNGNEVDEDEDFDCIETTVIF